MTAHDRRWLTAAIATALVVVSGAADAQPPGGDDSWTVSRLSDGQPDLQGVWTNATITPFERGTTMPYTLGVNVPEDSTTRTVFTEEEAAEAMQWHQNTGKKFVAFLSHHKDACATEARLIKG